MQEFVEQRKVIGFVGNPEALTGQGSVDYLTKASIPVAGSEGAGQWFYESPTYFPQGSTGNALLQAGAYLAAVTNKPHGITKVGMINCVEGGGRTSYATAIEQAAAELARHGRRDAEHVIIFFSDGAANYGPAYYGYRW